MLIDITLAHINTWLTILHVNIRTRIRVGKKLSRHLRRRLFKISSLLMHLLILLTILLHPSFIRLWCHIKIFSWRFFLESCLSFELFIIHCIPTNVEKFVFWKWYLAFIRNPTFTYEFLIRRNIFLFFFLNDSLRKWVCTA